MDNNKNIRVGIGFATGRKSFQKVLKTYVYNWKECGLTGKEEVSLNLLVAYDLKYSDTKSTDYTNVNTKILDLVDDSYFIGNTAIQREIDYLKENNIINEEEAQLFFRGGYAAKRNSVLYTAMKNKIDYLIFLDDDEYPIAVTNTRSSVIWGGQQVLSTHLKYIDSADITNGHHCGYISPIPYIKFNDVMTEDDFRQFIEAISNDIINWDNIRSVMNNGGVTYADTKILVNEQAEEVEEVNYSKFISGANLCINLRKSERVLPFYNPPGARGEDTFLSTCLSNRKVLRVPCYAFHDGFSTYNHLMDGVLPTKLKYIQADSEKIATRFYRACIGWIRYKPLLIYITQKESYETKIEEMRKQLQVTLPKICAYFNRKDFMNISKELERYNSNVEKHYNQFIQTQEIWIKINKFLNK
ncbi:hypothetical protein J2Z76_002836 [Sedimentibacter acidaminivorans]|uniref:Uncharacterized protein n=1 Tax=Sedimentibacter acidaminivorans TaxID=913099 RepID=A0ABS4GH40_9FIRM|nr:hypothetical protein [Sedimentibacter acidaminivorans]MBP1926964.1 hypothetical protein [Sedimentibacter acidaminivorans]